MVAIALIISVMAVTYVVASVFLAPKQPRHVSAPPDHAAMTRNEALFVLGLNSMASELDVQDAYFNVMKKAHPDHPGGSETLAMMANEARHILLDTHH